MALGKNTKTYQALQNAIDKAEDKLVKFQRKDDRFTLADFGFATTLLDRNPKNLTRKSANERIKMLEEFAKPEYGIVRISRANDGIKAQYMVKSEYDAIKQGIDYSNKFRKALRLGLKDYTSYYARIDAEGKVQREKKSNLYEEIDKKRDDLLSWGFQIKGGEFIGAEKGLRKTFTRGISGRKLKETADKYKGKAQGLKNKRVQDLENNYFKALAKNISPQFARSIRKILDSAGVDAIDFIGLYYTSGVFDFEFLYDEASVDAKKEEIKTQAKFIKDNPDYFSKLREKLEPFADEE